MNRLIGKKRLLFTIIAIFTLIIASKSLFSLWLASEMPQRLIQKKAPPELLIRLGKIKYQWPLKLSADGIFFVYQGNVINLRNVTVAISPDSVVKGRLILNSIFVGALEVLPGEGDISPGLDLLPLILDEQKANEFLRDNLQFFLSSIPVFSELNIKDIKVGGFDSEKIHLSASSEFVDGLFAMDLAISQPVKMDIGIIASLSPYLRFSVNAQNSSVDFSQLLDKYFPIVENKDEKEKGFALKIRDGHKGSLSIYAQGFPLKISVKLNNEIDNEIFHGDLVLDGEIIPSFKVFGALNGEYHHDKNDYHMDNFRFFLENSKEKNIKIALLSDIFKAVNGDYIFTEKKLDFFLDLKNKRLWTEDITMNLGQGFIKLQEFYLDFSDEKMKFKGNISGNGPDLSQINSLFPKLEGAFLAPIGFEDGKLKAELIWENPVIMSSFLGYSPFSAERITLFVDDKGIKGNIKDGKFDNLKIAGDFEGDFHSYLAKIRVDAKGNQELFGRIVKEDGIANLVIAGTKEESLLSGNIDFISVPSLEINGKIRDFSEISINIQDDLRTVQGEYFYKDDEMLAQIWGVVELQRWFSPLLGLDKSWKGDIKGHIYIKKKGESFVFTKNSNLRGNIISNNMDLSRLVSTYPKTGGKISGDFIWEEGIIKKLKASWENAQIFHLFRDDEIKISAHSVNIEKKDDDFLVEINRGDALGLAFGLKGNIDKDGNMDGISAVVIRSEKQLGLSLGEGSSSEITIKGTIKKPQLLGNINLKNKKNYKFDCVMDEKLNLSGNFSDLDKNLFMAFKFYEGEKIFDIQGEKADLIPIIRLIKPDIGENIKSSITGSTRIALNGDDLSAKGDIKEIFLDVDGMPITNNESIQFVYENAILDIGKFRLILPGGYLELSAKSQNGGWTGAIKSEIKGLKLSGFSKLLDSGEDFKGNIQGKIEKSKEDMPEFIGNIQAGGIKISLPDYLDQRIDIKNVEIVSEGKKGRISTFSGNIGNSPLIVSGLYSWSNQDKNANFDISTKKAKLSKGKIYSGDHNVEIKGSWDDDILKVDGLIDILSAKSELPSKASTDEPFSPPLWLELNLKLKSENGIRLDHSLFSIESFGSLDIKAKKGKLGILGSINTRRGWLSFRERRFDLVKGNVNFNDLDKIDPGIDLSANSKIGEYSVNLKVNGQLSALETQLSSTPALEEGQVLSLIITGNTGISSKNQGMEAEEIVKSAGGMLLSGLVKSSLKKNMNLDDLSFEKLNDGGSRIRMSKYLGTNLHMTVIRTNEGSYSAERYEMDYRLKSNLHLQLATESQREDPEMGMKYIWHF